MKFLHRLPHLSALLIVFMTAYGLVGCAGSGATSSETGPSADPAAEPDSAAPAGPHIQLLTLNTSAIEYTSLYREESEALVPADTYLGVKAISPDNRRLAVAYAASDSSKLAIVDLRRRTVRQVASFSGRIVYSVSWALDGQALAFGYYRPTGGGDMGSGGVSVARVDGSVRSVGCQAATKVLKWLPSGNLAVRDNDNLYVVEASGCGTVSTLDVRKMHHITYSPDGRRMAYIFRDLVYDRENTEYVPDSTLYLADARGNDTNELFGDDYRARHLQWSPDGSRLAFDVRSKDDRTRRQIIVYDIAGDRLTYLIPPQAAVPQDEVQPQWSPSGNHVAFSLVGESARHAAVQVMGQTRTLGESRGSVWGWAGRNQVVFPTSEGTRIVNLEANQVHGLSTDEQLIHAWSASDTLEGHTDGAGETSE